MERLFKNSLSPEQEESFLNASRSGEVFCVHELSTLLKEFENIDFLQSFRSLIDKWTYDIDVHLEASRDEQTTKTVEDGATALESFNKGRSLLFNDVNRQAPLLSDWLSAIQARLELSKHTFSRCLVYATPKDGGNAAHFDQNINFVLQLKGEKTWWTAPNTSVKNPLERHVVGKGAAPELSTYLDAPLPTEFPETEVQSFQLKPGSLLFVPPGVWHKTRAQSDALSLNFTFSAPSFLELFQSIVRGRLIGSELWREQAKALKNPDQEEKLDFLIQHLASDMQNWSAKDIIEALES